MNAFARYLETSRRAFETLDLGQVEALAEALRAAWEEGRQVFLCGNGGSAGNAIHLANDLFYGVAKGNGPGLRVQALPANVSILTCLANDVSYEAIFSKQLEGLARPGDLLIVLSGSGNSPNILAAVRTAKAMGMTTFGILGYSGGACLALVDHPLHVKVDDMQISEDAQLAIGHMLMQWLWAHPVAARAR